MKSYKERLPEIDKAIFELSGEWGKGDALYKGMMDQLCFASVGEVLPQTFTEVCTRTEFKARVEDWRRLYGWRANGKGAFDYPSFNEWLKCEGVAKGYQQEIALRKGFNWQLSLDSIKLDAEATAKLDELMENPSEPTDELRELMID